jgi:tetratricopeptide (TPR) repeat protein
VLSAADRDVLGLAAVELWRRLRPDDPPLESLLALVADAEDLRADDDPAGYLEGLVRFLAAARDRVDPGAPDEIGGVRLPLGTLRMRMVLVAVRLVEQCPELAADAAAVAERWLDLVLTDDDATDRRIVLSTAAHLYEELGRLQDAERLLRGAVALAPDDLVTRKLLALHLHEHAAGDRARLVEALALWDSIRPPPDHPEVDRFTEIRDDIAESLRLHDTPGAGASS